MKYLKFLLLIISLVINSNLIKAMDTPPSFDEAMQILKPEFINPNISDEERELLNVLKDQNPDGTRLIFAAVRRRGGRIDEVYSLYHKNFHFFARKAEDDDFDILPVLKTGRRYNYKIIEYFQISIPETWHKKRETSFVYKNKDAKIYIHFNNSFDGVKLTDKPGQKIMSHDIHVLYNANK